WHPCAGGVQLELPNWNASAVCAQVAEAEDPPAISDADESNVFLRPVPQDSLNLTSTRNRQVHAAGLPVDVAELEAGLPNRRIVHDREEARRIRHHSPIEERFVVVKQIDQVDVAIEVCVLVAELHHHTAELKVLGLGHVRYEANDSERFLLGLRE